MMSCFSEICNFVSAKFWVMVCSHWVLFRSIELILLIKKYLIGRECDVTAYKYLWEL